MYLLNMSEFRPLGYPGNADTKKRGSALFENMRFLLLLDFVCILHKLFQ